MLSDMASPSWLACKMGIKWMTVTCDWCQTTSDEFDDGPEATEAGWWFVDGPGGEFCLCSKECMESFLPGMPEEMFEVPDTFDFEED